jgi:glycerophosphoryl diester phosphodiesterase
MDSGAAFIEVDLRQTKDGVFVLLHDSDLDRTTSSSGPIQDFPWENVSDLDAGSWFSSEYAAERLPTLDELLETVDGWNGSLVLEFKDPESSLAGSTDLSQELTAPGVPEIQIVSFDHDWLYEFGRSEPALALGELSVYPLRLPEPGQADRIGVHWLATILDPSLVARAHRRQLELWVWTVDHPLLIRLMSWKGADGITTNLPTQAVRILSSSPR